MGESEEFEEFEPLTGVKIVPNFNSFLWNRLNEISEAWDVGDYQLALQRACRLVYFLPNPIKEELKGDMNTIRKDLGETYGNEAIDMYTTHLSRNRQANRVAMVRLEPFIDKMVGLLDARGYLEFHRRRLESKDLDKLEREPL